MATRGAVLLVLGMFPRVWARFLRVGCVGARRLGVHRVGVHRAYVHRMGVRGVWMRILCLGGSLVSFWIMLICAGTGLGIISSLEFAVRNPSIRAAGALRGLGAGPFCRAWRYPARNEAMAEWNLNLASPGCDDAEVASLVVAVVLGGGGGAGLSLVCLGAAGADSCSGGVAFLAGEHDSGGFSAGCAVTTILVVPGVVEGFSPGLAAVFGSLGLVERTAPPRIYMVW